MSATLVLTNIGGAGFAMPGEGIQVFLASFEQAAPGATNYILWEDSGTDGILWEDSGTDKIVWEDG